MASSEPARGRQIRLPVLVGRSAEQSLLREHLRAMLAGEGRLVVIGGEAGIGKTALAVALGEEAAGRDVLALIGHCFDLTNTPPYGPWLDLVASYRPGNDLPPLPDGLKPGGIERISSQAALFAEVREFFAAVAAARPTVVVVEDLHWADPASVDLLRFLSTQIATVSLLLVVTYRVDDLTRRHPFYQLLPALIQQAHGSRIDLRRLEESDLQALVASRFRLSEPDETRLVAYLDRHAEGNPLYATELLRTLEEEALLRPGDDGWVLEELDRVHMPPLLRQVIDGRVMRLGEETRQPLAMAALIGQEVPLDLWSRVSGIHEDDLLEIVEPAVEAHLLDATDDGTRVRFVHALTREALYEGVMAPRRRVWHRQVGEALAALPDAGSDPDAVAYHFQQAGDSRALEWLVRAGERAQRAYAWLTAVERFAAAAALLDGVSGQEQARGQLLFRCGRLQRYTNAAKGIADLAEAERLANLVGDRILAAEATHARGLLRCFADDFRLGLVEMDAGAVTLEALPFDEARPSWATATWMADALPAKGLTNAPEFEPAAAVLHDARLHHRRASIPWFLAAAGLHVEARATAERFIEVVSGLEAGPLVLSATGHAFHALGIVHATCGEPDAARQAFAGSREAYRPLDHHAVIGFTLLCELRDVVIPYQTTDVAARRQVAAEAEQALRRAGGALLSGVSPRRAWLGVLFLEGAWDEAREIASDVPTHGNYYLRREITNVLGPLARHQGEPDLAWMLVRSLLTRGPATEPGGSVLLDSLHLQRLAADLSIDASDLSAARAWLQTHDRWLAWSGSVLGQADGCLGWARFHHATGDAGLARRFATDALTRASNPRQPLALLATHRFLGQLDVAAGDVNEATRHLNEALALAEACAAPFEHALTLLAMAELRITTSQMDEAASCLDEVRTICEPLGARPALADVDALANRLAAASTRVRFPAGLTEREVEVLRLVAAGLTDAEAAARLSISPRTVSQHLRSVYNKLDVSSRAAATRFAVEHHLT